MKTRLLTTVTLAALLAMLSLAPRATAQVASTAPSAVKTGTYKVEPYHTQIGFSISHFGFSNFSGFFSGASGTLTLDPDKISISKLDVSIPTASVLTTVSILDTELKGADWFDATKYPNATFVSTKVTKTSSDTATIVGDLTVHGVTAPVTLKARLVGSGVNPLDKSFTVGFEATGKLDRSVFGIKKYLPLVGDEVTLKIAGAFVLTP